MSKALPSCIEAEKALISCIFLNNDIVAEIIDQLQDDDFYYTGNKVIYKKALELYKKNIPIDILTVSKSMDQGLLRSIGGITYLTEIAASEFKAANYKTYKRMIKEAANKRRLIEACNEALNRAYSDETEVKTIVSIIQDSITSMSLSERNKTINAAEFMEKTLNCIEQNYNNGGNITGISTGYYPIDKATNGFLKGDLMVIAARPSMGKTALILNMLIRLTEDKKGCIFEMEMSEEKLGVRMLAAKTVLECQSLGRGQIKENDFSRLLSKCNEMAEKDNIFINCKSCMTVNEIRAEVKKLKIKQGLDVIFIDHLGKIKPDNIRATRNDQVGQITEGLKNLAKDLNVCVVVLSQLSRGCEARHDKRPMLSDLRDSGNIEQDADQVLLLYRDDYYAEREHRVSLKPGILDVMVAKNRDGEVGLIDLSYNTKYQIITEKPLFT